jgi:uncharacterized protein (TIRG00374 family)
MMSADTPIPNLEKSPSRRGSRDRLIVAVLLLALAVGLVGLARSAQWDDILSALSRLGWHELAILLALSLVNYVLRSVRWHLFAHSLGFSTPAALNASHYLGGFAMSVTPGRVGEFVRIRWLARDAGVALDRAFPVVLGDRASDLASLAILLAASLMLAAKGIEGAVFITLLALTAAFVAIHPRLLATVVSTIYRLAGRRAPRLFARLRRSALSLEAFAKGGVLLPALLLGMAGWAAEGYAFHLLLTWFGVDIGLWRALAIFIFSTLAGGLTGAPGGLGGAEAAMVALLSLDGTPLGVAVAATAVIRVTTLWFAVAIGLVAFPLAERATFKRGK